MRHCPSQIPATYPAAAPDIKLPELDGKTVKMYHGGKICTSIHFNPLWARNAPHLGIAHALIFGVCPCPLAFLFPCNFSLTNAFSAACTMARNRDPAPR